MHIYKITIITLSLFLGVYPIAAQPQKTLPIIINQDTFLSNDTLWILDGKCYVTNNAVLVIQEGARIEGIKKVNAAEASALVVTRGAMLYAIGNSTAPIVFTSHEGYNAVPGDWGGIVLMGRAPVNMVEPNVDGIYPPTVPAGVDIKFGGNAPHDLSGELQYVRIEYAGAAIATDNELNGLTCAGVGDATVLDYIEVAYAFDDAFEFFGGTVNAKHLFALAPQDDAFDFSTGYSGYIQYAVSVLRNTIGYSSNPNGIESQNDEFNIPNPPITKPIFSNMTVIGLETFLEAAAKGLMNGALFRKSSAFDLRNSVLMGFITGLDHSSQNADKNFCHNIVQAFTTLVKPTPFPVVTCDASTNIIITGGYANDNISLTNPFGSVPDFRPAAGSPALTNATSFTGLPAFFDHVSYRGAFDVNTSMSNNWLAGWANYYY